MGLEQVKSEVLNEARQKAEQIVNEAEEEAEEIIEEAEKEAEKIHSQTEDEIEAEKESIRRKQLSGARMEARDEKLRTKQEKLDAVFQNFSSRLEEMDEEERKKFVENCIERTEFEVGKAYAGKEFVDSVEEQNVEVEEKDIQGIILVSENGERRINFSFEKIIENYRSRYRKEVSERIF